VTETLLSTFGLYGGALVISFIAGLFPLVSIEVFLVGVSAWAAPSAGGYVALILIAAFGHQIAKSITYYAGAGALERGKIKASVEKFKARIERWNRRPKLVMFLGATLGFPPLLLLGFIAHPIMNMRFVPFTIICLAGRIGRYAFMMVAPLVVG
jgi:membrane protein YqaA with SNARE-associated domain